MSAIRGSVMKKAVELAPDALDAGRRCPIR